MHDEHAKANPWKTIVQLQAQLAQARTEVEGLKQRLEQAEAQITSVAQAVEWLWGFWDGNTLVARSSGYEEDINAAWDRLLKASDAFGKPVERLPRMGEAAIVEAEGLRRQLAEMEAGRDSWRTRSRMLEQAAEATSKTTLALQAERRLRREAERRAEIFYQELAGAHEALDECQVRHNYGDSVQASIRTRIFWLNTREGRAEALAALVTPELAGLLEWLSRTVKQANVVFYSNSRLIAADKLAARIREALAQEGNDED